MITYHVIEGNRYYPDGGAMFGHCPKELWKKWAEPDPQNRIEVATRALLILVDGKKILFDAGMGNFFSPKMRKRYGLVGEENALITHLEQMGHPHDTIDEVILSHLHFDHAGGILSPYEEGKALSLLFPRATFYLGARHFARAQHPTPRDHASFIPELPQLLLDSKRLVLLKEGDPSPWGEPFSFSFLHGHTPGLMLVEVEQLLLVTDLVPGLRWVHLPITLSYDRFAEKVVEEKQALLERAVREQLILFFPHDPDVPFAQVVLDDKGQYKGIEPSKSIVNL